MARSFNEIYDQMVQKTVSVYAALGVTINPALWSKYSPRRITHVIVATCIQTFEQVLDAARQDIDTAINTRKTHGQGWYQTKAKEYQHGHALVKDQDYYNNTGLTDEQIEEARVIKYSAVVEVFDNAENLKGIRIKVATLVDDDLAPVPDIEFAGFSAYMETIKDAGLRIYKSTAGPDDFKAELDMYYDPLILDSEGKRLDGTNDKPVQDAITDFLLTGMGFNGRFVTAYFIDRLQGIDGVVIPHPVLLQAKYGELPFADIVVKYTPDAGYMRISDPENNLTLNFIAYE